MNEVLIATAVLICWIVIELVTYIVTGELAGSTKSRIGRWNEDRQERHRVEEKEREDPRSSLLRPADDGSDPSELLLRRVHEASESEAGKLLRSHHDPPSDQPPAQR